MENLRLLHVDNNKLTSESFLSPPLSLGLLFLGNFCVLGAPCLVPLNKEVVSLSRSVCGSTCSGGCGSFHFSSELCPRTRRRQREPWLLHDAGTKSRSGRGCYRLNHVAPSSHLATDQAHRNPT